jgi:hypothetical protein
MCVQKTSHDFAGPAAAPALQALTPDDLSKFYFMTSRMIDIKARGQSLFWNLLAKVFPGIIDKG